MKIYLAGGLFNAGERLHNLYLEKYLRELNHEVIVPQRVALTFFKDGYFDTQKIVADCREKSIDSNNIYVGNIDGADADAGTAVEYGMAIIATGRAIIYRTDFRTATEKELGVNAMLRAESTELIYEPCFFTELEEVDTYYKNLALRIGDAVKKLNNENLVRG